MNNTTISLSKLIEKATNYLIESNYAPATISNYTRKWSKFLLYSQKQGYKYFSYELGMEFLKVVYEIYDEKKLSRYQVHCTRCIKALDELLKYGFFLKCHHRKGISIVPEYKVLSNAYIKYQESLGWTSRTIYNKKNNITKFLNDLSQQGIKTIENMTADNIFKYMERQKHFSTTTTTTRSAILFALREFLRYLYDKRYTEQPLYDLFPVIFTNKYEKLPSYYHEGEVKRILAEVDNDTIIGKRDYLILILAIQLGIRAGDIRALKLENINWDRNTLELIQQKTGNPIQLPLTENIRFALIDYLKNSRPKTDSSHVFIRHRAPNIPFAKNNVFYNVINKYLKTSKVKISGRKHGLHSMRHSMASSLLKNNTPYPVITGILGHENSDTTKNYLRINIEQLRSVSLAVPYEK